MQVRICRDVKFTHNRNNGEKTQSNNYTLLEIPKGAPVPEETTERDTEEHNAEEHDAEEHDGGDQEPYKVQHNQEQHEVQDDQELHGVENNQRPNNATEEQP